MTALAHTWFLMQRHLRQLLRQPWWIGLTLAQPIIWLVLYGQLFQKVVNIPGFHTRSYVEFIAPGVVIMSALFGSGWNGMGIIQDLDLGIMDRLLISPASRFAIIGGRLLHMVIVIVVQSGILLGLAFILGARYSGGVAGVAALIGCAVLMAVPFGALSNAWALILRRPESVIGAVNMLLLPLTFLSPVFIAKTLMPDWMRMASRFNPVNWAVETGRAALQGEVDWPSAMMRIGALVAFGIASSWLATRAFRTYQRSA